MTDLKLMYDSTNAFDIPASASIVAGYVDGKYAWSAADWARFDGAIKVRIAVFASTNDGDVLDVEQGDATPQQAPGWIMMRQAAGLAVPTIYCAASMVGLIRSLCDGLTYDLWTADYNGVPHITGTAQATQYADPNYGSGGHYDLTLCTPEWPRRSNPMTPTTDDLTTALAYVCDTLGDRVWKLQSTAIMDVDVEIQAIVTEIRRVRAQFLGPRP